MASLTKTKVVYGVKLRRGSQSYISIDRTGLDVQEIPPELCHLTGDALATPFPHIALGGYIRYYKTHSGEHLDSPQEQEQEIPLKDGLKEIKKRRRASFASTLLGPLLSHTPKPWPSNEVPGKSYLFHTRSPSSSPPASPVSATSRPSSPFARLKRTLAIIPEASRETMRATDVGSRAESNTFPRKISAPPMITPTQSSSLTASAVVLSLAVTPPPRTSSLAKSNSVRSTASSAPSSPTGSLLRRRKRQLLRTPSVEKDFAKCAKDLLGLGKADGVIDNNKEGSCSSVGEVTEPEGGERSPAVTSIFESSSAPSSPTRVDGDGNEDRVQPESAALHRPLLISHAKSDTSQSTEGGELSEAESSASVAVSTPPTSVGCGSVEDEEKVPEPEGVDQEEDITRDSWASYQTAKSFIEVPL